MSQAILDALRRGDHAQAATDARAAVAVAPDDAQAHRWLATALAAGGEREEALASMERAIALAPEDADLHFQLAGLLLGVGQRDAAQAALGQSVQLDPNQFGAYILQAQLALGRNDLDEAERLQRFAARIQPDHVWVSTIEGMLALRRGDVQGAQALLSRAAERAPDDAQVRHALGFAYMAAGHDAFAEQAFRGVLENSPGAQPLRGLVAELLRRQGRFGDAAQELQPLLDDEKTATPALQRFAGELQLAAGRHDLALPLLRSAFDTEPRDRRTLNGLIEAWRRNGDADDARTTLESALSSQSDNPDLWRARLAFEPMVGGAGLEVVQRWLAAMPDYVPALEAHMALLGADGRAEQAGAVATRIVELQPGHGMAEMRLIDAKLQHDPQAAIAHIDDLLARASDDDSRRLLQAWKALAQDRAGDYAGATQAWAQAQAADAPKRLPLPELTDPEGDWPVPDIDEEAAPAPSVAFLVGAPGSGVERLAALLGPVISGFRGDRFGASPPQDALQNVHTPAGLFNGERHPADVVDSWYATLPARGIDNGEVLDWLLWWDNALLRALRAGLPQASLLVALRDPRDMLLEWLAFGAPAPLRMETPELAAQWLARELEHIAVLHEQQSMPHTLLRMDDISGDAIALTALLAQALNTPLPEPSVSALVAAHFPAGHWRHYRDALAGPIALLTPVAVRLGYPEA